MVLAHDIHGSGEMDIRERRQIAGVTVEEWQIDLKPE